MKWYVQVLSRYTESDGSTPRKEYGCFVLLNILISIEVCLYITIKCTFDMLAIFYALVILCSGLAMNMRRFNNKEQNA